jgi:hypothetical protein
LTILMSVRWWKIFVEMAHRGRQRARGQCMCQPVVSVR